jgi:hypothetical protein
MALNDLQNLKEDEENKSHTAEIFSCGNDSNDSHGGERSL